MPGEAPGKSSGMIVKSTIIIGISPKMPGKSIGIPATFNKMPEKSAVMQRKFFEILGKSTGNAEKCTG